MATQYRKVQPALIEHRAAQRRIVHVSHATVRAHGEQPVEATLLDLSTFGCRIETEAAAVAGERLWLRLGGGMPIAAEVVWSDAGTMGCRFDAAIDRLLVRSLTLGDY